MSVPNIWTEIYAGRVP